MDKESIKNFLISGVKTCNRFPLPVFCLLLFAVLNNMEAPDFRLKYACLIGVIWFAEVKLYVENKEWDRDKYLFLSLPPFLCFVFYFFLWHHSNIDFLLLASGLFLSLIGVAVFFQQSDEDSFWWFSSKLSINLFFAIILGAILSVGLILIMLTMVYLFFDVKIPEICWTVIATSGFVIGSFYFLSTIPERFKCKESLQLHSAFKVIVSYVLIPLIMIYAVILYLYMVKMGIQWQLPQGQIGYIVTSFGVIGILTYLIAYPVRKESMFLRFFYRYFYIASLPLVLLLFFGTGIRLNQYGVTESRYFLLILALWYGGLSFLFVFMRNHCQIKLIPLILSLLLVLSSFGPWGMVRLSIVSQTGHLKNILVKNAILVDGKITKNHPPVSFEDKKRISSLVYYLSEREDERGVEKVKVWFDKKDNDTFQCAGKTSGVSETTCWLNEMGLNYISPWEKKN